MSVLDKIIENKKKELLDLKSDIDTVSLKNTALNKKSGINFLDNLKNSKNIPVIAEIKKKSPSKGSLNEYIDIKKLAGIYEKSNASAISVLTDSKYFGGNINDIIDVKNTVKLPVLRKDFIIDSLLIYEAKAAGADAVLLIAEALKDDNLEELFFLTKALNMTPLVEIHDKAQIDRVLSLKPDLIGINNRNLVTLKVDINHCIELRKYIPDNIFVVGESGIETRDDITKMLNNGINAFLIGTTLMKSGDPGMTLANFTSL